MKRLLTLIIFITFITLTIFALQPRKVTADGMPSPPGSYYKDNNGYYHDNENFDWNAFYNSDWYKNYVKGYNEWIQQRENELRQRLENEFIEYAKAHAAEYFRKSPPLTYTSTVVVIAEVMGWLTGFTFLFIFTNLRWKKCLLVSGLMMVVSYAVGLLMWYVVL